MADIFDVTVANVSSYMTKMFREGELERDSVVKQDLITASDGRRYNTMLYELEAVISLGMRVSSKKGTHFRIWSRQILKEYLIKGFVMDDQRLKNPDGRPDFFDELLDRIRDIRSSEKRMWTREEKIAKNYYTQIEIEALNILTSAVLEFFQSQAEQRRQTTLRQFLEKMRDFIKLDGRLLIPAGHLGGLSMGDAKEKAAAELAIYKERVRLAKETSGEVSISALLQQARMIARSKKG